MPFRVRHVLAATALLAACGGRYAEVEGEGGGASSGASTGSGGSGQGGKKAGGKAGNSSTAGSSSVGGKSTGTAGTAGCACPDVDCAPGYVKQLNPSGCCEVCVPLDCTLVPCPGVACGSGSQLYYPPDQCCPVCGPSTCEEQRKNYIVFREQLVAKYSGLGCMSDMDCTVLYDSNACSVGCGGAAIPWLYEKDIHLSLEAYAKACTGCPPLPVPPCEPPLPAACVQGRCQTRPFR
ncbi:MAG TPA: hypothetical protein VEX18_15135 [Polyangiaceae bacterium]|nr:hypothetical protein [Polyangiaceae bacterium]